MVVGILLLVVALLVLLYLFLIMPRTANKADMELLVGSYAHRGLWDERIPENSLAAFAHAISAGYGIELDIQLSRDRRIMVFHDDDLKRMCGVEGRISDLTYDELRRLRLLGTDQVIPTLEEVLALVRGRVPLMIEIKSKTPHPALCVRAARRLDTYGGPFCIVSFNPMILSWFKNYRPSYARGQLVTKPKRHTEKGSRPVSFLLFHMLLNCLSRPDFISVNLLYKNRPVFLLCAKLLHTPIFAWTVRAPSEYRACRNRGISVIFEKIRPETTKLDVRKGI